MGSHGRVPPKGYQQEIYPVEGLLRRVSGRAHAGSAATVWRRGGRLKGAVPGESSTASFERTAPVTPPPPPKPHLLKMPPQEPGWSAWPA